MDHFKSFSAVQKLSLRELDKLCLNFGILKTLPRNVKVNAVCHCLGLSTSGTQSLNQWMPQFAGARQSQLAELRALSPKVFYGLDGWTKDLRGVPAIDDGITKQYLLKNCILNGSSMRTYKLTRPFQLKAAVHSVEFNELGSSSLCVIRALCNPSQSTDKDEVKMVHVVLDKANGEPYGGYCTCTVGFVIWSVNNQVVHC